MSDYILIIELKYANLKDIFQQQNTEYHSKSVSNDKN